MKNIKKDKKAGKPRNIYCGLCGKSTKLPHDVYWDIVMKVGAYICEDCRKDFEPGGIYE